jgi:hypothetical protein
MIFSPEFMTLTALEKWPSKVPNFRLTCRFRDGHIAMPILSDLVWGWYNVVVKKFIGILGAL